MTSPRFLRFYDFDDSIQGYRFFSLEDGDAVSSSSGGQHEEGWSRSYMTWRREGLRVICEWTTEGRDCDGYTRRDGVCWAMAGDLAARTVEDADGGVYPFKVPEWQHGRVTCRDESAEAAGY